MNTALSQQLFILVLHFAPNTSNFIHIHLEVPSFLPPLRWSIALFLFLRILGFVLSLQTPMKQV